MSEVGEELAKDAASRVLSEAVDEVKGRSNRSWAVVLVTLVFGAAVVFAIMKLRARRSAA